MMGKIGKWKKIGLSSWVLDRGKKAYNIYVYVVRTMSFKKLYGDNIYQGIVEIRGTAIDVSKAYKNHEDARKWCIRYMNRHKGGI